MSHEPEAQSLALAVHWLEVGQPAKALEALSELPEELLGEVEPWLLRAGALSALDREEEALAATERALALDANHPGCHYLRADSLHILGRLAEAEKAILTALRSDPEDVDYLLTYAQITASGGHFEKAHRLIEKAAAVAPESPELARARYFIAIAQGDDKAAVRWSEEMVSQEPHNAAALAATGHARNLRGQVATGYDRLRRAAAQDVRVVDGVREHFQELRVASHWLLWPLRPLHRWGAGKIWGVAVAGMLLLRALGQNRLLVVWAAVYLLFCIYSWTAPPLLRRVLRRRFR